jgi:hypothetical protein
MTCPQSKRRKPPPPDTGRAGEGFVCGGGILPPSGLRTAGYGRQDCGRQDAAPTNPIDSPLSGGKTSNA